MLSVEKRTLSCTLARYNSHDAPSRRLWMLRPLGSASSVNAVTSSLAGVTLADMLVKLASHRSLVVSFAAVDLACRLRSAPSPSMPSLVLWLPVSDVEKDRRQRRGRRRCDVGRPFLGSMLLPDE
eukprot:scaffold385_cov305-Pinguiococcus_pyrenoidosus.AAC.1